MSAGVKDKSLNSYTIYVCTCVRCVCVMRGGRGKGGSFPVAAVKVKSLNPLPEGGGAQPIMNDQETILVVHKFNTRGLAIKLSN